MSEGVTTVKEKEMIALGIALGIQCEPCIRLHVQKCLDAGVTKEQIMEVCGVATMMAGGPAFTHIPMVMDSLEALNA
jgi:AhpD family alkylhydroperoxidase